MDKTVYDIIPLFLYDLTQNSDEDGYNIVMEYLDSDYMRIKTLHDKIGKSATSDLIKKGRRKMIVMHSGKLWRYSHLVILLIYISYTIRNIRQKNISAVIFGH